MLACPGLALLLFLSPSNTQPCPAVCKCTSFGSYGYKVNCSSRGLTVVPMLPPQTTELYLQNNLLTTVPRGRLDKLQHLNKVNMSNNTWDCGCDIIYLKTRLDDQEAISRADVKCFTPASLAGKPLSQLRGHDLAQCTQIKKCPDLVYNNILLLLSLCILIILLAWSLKITRTSTFIYDLNARHADMELESLKSMDPKPRWKRSDALSKDLLEEGVIEVPLPTDNMEILNPILHILQTNHNIKLHDRK
ncbi:platelet glycoprotein IX-like [Polyodon spathula]|uniref:platelet glycoprotein IX-like n=1 Tax=Polyodon spathula TaxID=7913 RepID=UPI001B7E4416|nr:platelet glycoprotein IX-like [Polyodon spathula]